MIELPESHVLAEQINRTVAGKEILYVTANQSPHGCARYSGNPSEYSSKLRGKRVSGADVFCGFVRIAADDMCLLISAPIKYHAPGEKLPEKHQLLVLFDDGSAISCTVRVWGAMFCYRQGEEAEGIPVGHHLNTEPSPLDDRFDYAYFRSLAASEDAKSLCAKAFLATEQRIVGMGNGVLQDILWNAHVHPKRRMDTLSEAEFRALFDSVKKTLADMVAQGGRDTERDLFGQSGGYKTVLKKTTAGSPCAECGSTIINETYLGGAIYYCPTCQQL
ncbi:MAG: endonuclease VIII [Bacillota bacterium]|jgi:formamidopyrimidine-DNA glycosylase|nr:endonuclease VIII [Candidatus Fermentithermobacillaceae bacterium]